MQGLGILMLTLMLTELAFRAVHHVRPSFIFSSDSYNRFRPPPNTQDYDFQLNSLGFKDLEPADPKQAYRVVAIGDSFAYGVVPYAHNYLTVLDDLLDRQGKPVEVVNMGIPRLDVLDYRQLLFDEGLGLDPDFVLVGFFIGNDFHVRPRSGKRPVSYVAEFFRYVLTIWPKQNVGLHPTEYQDHQPTFSQGYFLKIREGQAQPYLAHNTLVERNLPNLVSVLKHMQETCEQQGIGMLVTLLPDELQVDQDLQRQVAAIIADGRPVDWARPSLQIADALREAEIPVLDLLPAFVQRGKHLKLYKPRDTHWNIAGNRLAAELIQERLAETIH